MPVPTNQANHHDAPFSSQRTDALPVRSTGAPKASSQSRSSAASFNGARFQPLRKKPSSHLSNQNRNNLRRFSAFSLTSLRPIWNIAGPVLKLGRRLSLLAAVMGFLSLGNLFAQNMGDTLTWNGSSSWVSSTVGTWYDNTLSTNVKLSSINSEQNKTYNFIFTTAGSNSKAAATGMTISAADIFATSITFNEGFNSSNKTSFTNGSAGSNTSITFGAGNGSASVLANATAWTLANNATTGNITFANGATKPLDIKLFSSGNISVVNSGAIITISSNITNWNGTITGGITKTGSGTLTLNGTNTYTGSTTINAGNLTISGGAAIADNGTVILANTAGVNFNVNASETIGALQGGGTTGGTVNIAASQTLTVNQTSDQTFAGVIAGSTGALTKIGANTLTLLRRQHLHGHDHDQCWQPHDQRRERDCGHRHSHSREHRGCRLQCE
jgi:autotransporter-associated beta strand protein